MFRSRHIRTSVVIALLATPLFLFSDRALAIQDSEDKVGFGPVSVGAGQGARINVYAIGNPDVAPWEFVVRIFNRRGEVAQERRFQVAPSVIASSRSTSATQTSSRPIE